MTPEALAAALAQPRRRLPDPPKPQANLAVAGISVAIHLAGRRDASRRALLVHGWESDHRDLDPIAAVLGSTGTFCVAPDLPAHGASGGSSMTIPAGAACLQAVDAAYGPFDLAVGHSMGCAIILYALARGMRADKVAFIAPPLNYAHELARNALAAGAPQPLIHAALAAFRRLCPDLDAIDSVAMARHLTMSGLIAVAGRDKVVDPENGRVLAASWPGSRVIACAEASHRGILHDPRVADSIRALLQSSLRAA